MNSSTLEVIYVGKNKKSKVSFKGVVVVGNNNYPIGYFSKYMKYNSFEICHISDSDYEKI